MNLLVSDVEPYAQTLKAALDRMSAGRESGGAADCLVAVCVPFLHITTALKAFEGSRIAVGAQDVSEAEKGARTGEVSAVQLRRAGVKYAIIGHSERRQYHCEDDGLINRKLRAAHSAGLIPILCVGETLGQREKGTEFDVVRRQLKEAFFELSTEAAQKTVVAYEPVWAIGTGKTATPLQAGEMCAEIRAVIKGLYGAGTARSASILYGGSMNAENAAELLAQPDIDGGLIGGASLDAENFAAIVEAACK